MTAKMKKLKLGSKGFTLVELIVVIVIIVILASVLVVSLVGYIRKAKIAVVTADGRFAYEAAQSLAIEQYAKGWTGGPTADEVLALSQMKGEIVTMTFTTPGQADASADKPFRYRENDITVKYADLVWTVDDGAVSSGETASSAGASSAEVSSSASATYPGTTIAIQNSLWPQASDYVNSWDSVAVSAGGIFQYTDGGYYIVNKDLSLTKSQAASGPGGEVYNWFATQRITGRVIIDWTDGKQKKDLSRGDIVTVGSDYYVFIDGGSTAYAPDSPKASAKSWYKIP